MHKYTIQTHSFAYSHWIHEMFFSKYLTPYIFILFSTTKIDKYRRSNVRILCLQSTRDANAFFLFSA